MSQKKECGEARKSAVRGRALPQLRPSSSRRLGAARATQVGDPLVVFQRLGKRPRPFADKAAGGRWRADEISLVGFEVLT